MDLEKQPSPTPAGSSSWPNGQHAGDLLLFTVAAMGGGGIYDMYTMNPNGSNLLNITPIDWPSEFLCSHGIFSNDDLKIYFVGEWWE
ncbi:hypothetical protein EH221_06935 [bacterium]|nr:MAG: hypothetical protein EH221_06935 [bacterium]